MVETSYVTEQIRLTEYLNPVTCKEMFQIMDHELLYESKAAIFGDERNVNYILSLFENEKIDDLRRLFTLFQRLKDDGLFPMVDMLRKFVDSKCADILNQRQYRLSHSNTSFSGTTSTNTTISVPAKEKNEDNQFVLRMINLNEKCTLLVRVAFGGNSNLARALNEAFVNGFNKSVGQHTNVELLVSFSDVYLRCGGTTVTDSEIDQVLENIIQLFLYVHDKDLFAEIYVNALAKRLLNQRSRSIANEKNMIIQLKTHCGPQYTSKMEGMLNDLFLSQDSTEAYLRGDVTAFPTPTIADFSVQVLTTGFWPTYKEPKITIPSIMKECINSYTNWYNSKYSRRRLRWTMGQGSASVKGTFGGGCKKIYDFQLTTLQAIALLSFNDGVQLTYLQLAHQLELEDETLRPLLHSLSCGKSKVITKNPSNNKICKTDSFTANSKFTSNQRKIRIPMATLDHSFDREKLDENRRFVIEAAIVRIMKTRKRLSHQNLVVEVVRQLSILFKPEVRDIKLRIESLLERSYLMRCVDDENNINGFYMYQG
jgi:cullin 1